MTAVRFIVLAAALACPAPGVVAEEPDTVAWLTRQAEATRSASATGRPVFVDVWAVWCAPCRRMEETTFRDPAVVTALRSFVPLKVDADAQPIFAEHFRVEIFPTYLVLDADAREIARWTGYQSSERLLASLRSVLEGYDVYARLVAMKGDPRALREAARYLRRVGHPERAVDLLRWATRIQVALPIPEREGLETDLAGAQLEAGETRAAVKSLKRLVEEAEDPGARAAARELLDRAQREKR